ncbi:hypothetical protein B9Z55_007501 [Caenorhabditis nigoni]|nr:hypothetical protein B9Z55_007501 [Caenorhabditis nigoni]
MGPDEFTGSLEDEKLQMERETDQHFKKNVEKRGKSYNVKLAFESQHEKLPGNYAIMVDAVFKEQLKKNILEIVDPDEDTGDRLIHYNPHQPVLTPSKTTTKCRVVVDGSAHFKGKPSRNDQINQGPRILPDWVIEWYTKRAMALDAPNDAKNDGDDVEASAPTSSLPTLPVCSKKNMTINLEQMASCFTDGNSMEPCGRPLHENTIHEPHMEVPDKTRNGEEMECGDYRSGGAGLFKRQEQPNPQALSSSTSKNYAFSTSSSREPSSSISPSPSYEPLHF